MTLLKMMKGFLFTLFPGIESKDLSFYGKRTPKIDLKSFLQGETQAWGAIFDRRGRQTRSFSLLLKGTWTGSSGVLEEWFEFDRGPQNYRSWALEFKQDHSFSGTASDVTGQAIGRQCGNAVNSHYVLQVPYKKSFININADDWMYALQGEVLLNRIALKKFGFKVGELVIFMKKPAQNTFAKNEKLEEKKK